LAILARKSSKERKAEEAEGLTQEFFTLGKGGMGTVYLLVRSHFTGQRFAVKKTRFRDEASQRDFLRELQTWLDLPEHPL
jgi:hypothetical protein